jgi:hypothetical protein
MSRGLLDSLDRFALEEAQRAGGGGNVKRAAAGAQY